MPPVHFRGRNSHISTAEHTERMAATPLRPRHRCEAHTNPHHSWRQRKPCVKISHPLVDGADTTRLVEKPFLAMALGCRPVEDHVEPPGRRSRRRPRGAARRRAGARCDGEVWKGDNKAKLRNLPNIQRSGNRGAPMVPGSTAGHATGSQMVQLGSSRRVTFYSVAITAPARPPAPPWQWWRSCGWA